MLVRTKTSERTTHNVITFGKHSKDTLRPVFVPLPPDNVGEDNVSRSCAIDRLRRQLKTFLSLFTGTEEQISFVMRPRSASMGAIQMSQLLLHLHTYIHTYIHTN